MTRTNLIPRRALYGNPVKASAKISPDGEKLAWLAPDDNVMNVWVAGLDGADARAVTRDRERGIAQYFWSADSRHIFFAQDIGGDENYHLYSVDLEGGDARDLTPFENVRVMIIDRSRDFPDDMLIGLNRDNPQLHDVYNLHLPTGELKLLEKNPGNVLGWIADRSFKVRAALTVREDGSNDLLIRRTEQSEWEVYRTWTSDDALTSAPIGFSKDGRYLRLLDSLDANAGRLVELDTETREIRVIAEDPEYDVSGAYDDPHTYEVRMVAFLRARLEWTVLDDAIREDIEAIRKIHDGDFTIISEDDADRKWVVRFYSDNDPGSFYLYRRDTRSGELLFQTRPELDGYQLAPMEPVTITARDGMQIHCYITFPVGAERRNLPLVLNVHGGPWVRDTWGYHSEAQWMANRGYVCLQVNYRGSRGYGKAYLNAGNREWGGKMHDDLVDAVKWAVAQGYVDPERVAIYGGSYGGYAALVGATFTPELFRCAIDIVGPSNLITFIRSVPPYWQPMIKMLHTRVGNPDTEPEFLASRSPLTHVDSIRIPMLIVQGANDPRVKQAESEQIVAAMREHGIAHEYMLFPDEGHGFQKPENKMKFYAAAEKFLADHLGGIYEDADMENGDVVASSAAEID
jgi:dipeptidyl aminopeptidase/acylaminoacyl peptidase